MSGVDAKIGIGREAAWGTPVPSIRHFTCRESLTDQRGRLRDPMTFGTRSTLPADPGRVTINGSLSDIPGRPATVGEWLAAALGAPVTVGAAAPYTHTFTPKSTKHSATAALPPISATVKRSATLIDRFTGGQVDSLELRQPVDDVLMLNADLLFKAVAAGTDEVLTLDAGARFRYKHLAVAKGGVPFPYLTDLTLRIANNLDPEQTLNESDEISGVDFGDKLAITLNLTLTFRDETILTDFRAGTADAWTFTWTIDAGNSLVISIPKLAIDSASAPIDGPGRITLTASATAEFDAVAGHEIEFVLTNDVTTYA